MFSTNRPQTSPRTAVVVLTVATLVATVLLGIAPSGAAPIHRPLESTRPLSAAPVEIPFSIEYFGLSAHLADGAASSEAVGQVRFRTAGTWGPWRELGEDGAQELGQFSSALLSVADADAYQVRGLPASFADVRVTAMNLTDGPVIGARSSLGTAAGALATCASRADWNADESITGWTKGTDKQAFSPDQVLTVHHTAGSNDPAQNYANTVLAIERYHVLTNGWSDIGYQFLIDPNGVVYEGRNAGQTSKSCATGGGDGSDFAHSPTADGVVTGAHVGGYNTGNLGIALLGCFDAGNATCSGTTTPTTAATAALQNLLAKLSTRHGLNPTGTVTYTNPVNGNVKAGMPTISGHRDWEATACPGGTLYSQLPTLRTGAASDMRPTNVQSSVTDTSARLTWLPGAAWPAPVPRATKFRVTRQGGPTSTVTALSYDDTGLSAGTSYTYDLVAIASDGSVSSNATSTTVTTTGTAPTTPPPSSSSDFSMTLSSSSGTTAAASTSSPATITTAVSSGAASSISFSVVVSPDKGVTGSAATINAGQSTPLSITATPAATGNYTVTITGTNTTGATHSTSFALTVTNAAPSAAIAPVSCAGASCTFSGSGTDPEGSALTYGWTIANGSPSSAVGPSVTSKYSSPGTSAVTLQTTDAAGLTGTAAVNVSCSWSTKGKTRTLVCKQA